MSWAPAPPKVRLLACAACCLLLQLSGGGRLGFSLESGSGYASGGSDPGRVLAARRLLQGGGGGEAPLQWHILGGEHPEWEQCALWAAWVLLAALSVGL